MNLSTLRAPRGANSNKKRVGRGMGSGMGKTSARGHKGQRSRSGSRMMRGFEGGQMPLHRRIPKRGFTNIFKVEYVVVNLDRIGALAQKEVTPDVLLKAGLIKRSSALIKILGDGELKSAVTVHAHRFSKSALDKITAAGGKAEYIGEPPAAPVVKAAASKTVAEKPAAEAKSADKPAAEKPAAKESKKESKKPAKEDNKK
jgi:large subunit ribosomal protein L15